MNPDPVTVPVTAGESLAGCSPPPEQLSALFEAGRKYRSFRYWHKVRVGSSESRITGQGFNAVKFDPNKPARTIRRNDGNLGMHGAMHWCECRRFSLPIMNPYLVIANHAVKKVRSLLAEFGMSPNSRSRIAAPGSGHGAGGGEWMDLLDC